MSGTEQNTVNCMQQLFVEASKSGQTEKTTQPAIATIDRPGSLGSSNPPELTRSSDMDPHTLEQLRAVKEMLTAIEEEIQSLQDLNTGLRKGSNDCETKITKLTEQNDEYAEKEKVLSSLVAETVRNNKKMSFVIEELERTLSSLINERETEIKRWTDECATLLRERDEAAADLASIEHSFNYVHNRYEKSKVIIQEFKGFEKLIKQSISESNDGIQKMKAKYNTLRQHATQTLDKAYAKIDSINKSYKGKIIKLHAILKKKQIISTSLQASLEQRIAVNEELIAMCDELIKIV